MTNGTNTFRESAAPAEKLSFRACTRIGSPTEPLHNFKEYLALFKDKIDSITVWFDATKTWRKLDGYSEDNTVFEIDSYDVTGEDGVASHVIEVKSKGEVILTYNVGGLSAVSFSPTQKVFLVKSKTHDFRVMF